MLNASTILLEYVCPAFGALTANLMFFAPVRDVRESAVHGDGLGSLNPTPWAFMLGNTFGWVAYGLMLQNIFVFVGNAPGLLVSIWLNLQAVKLQYESFRRNEWKRSIAKALRQQEKSQITRDGTNNAVGESTVLSTAPSATIIGALPSNDSKDLVAFISDMPTQSLIPPQSHDAFVLANASLWVVVLAILSFGGFTSNTREFVVGMVTNALCVVFYASPLSTIGQVLKQRNASTIHIPTMITNTCNGFFWAAYGFTVSDHFISVPNSLGAALGVIQILLCLVFPRQVVKEATPGVASDEP